MMVRNYGEQKLGVMPGRKRPAINLGTSENPAETWRASRFQLHYTLPKAICKQPVAENQWRKIIAENQWRKKYKLIRRRRFPA